MVDSDDFRLVMRRGPQPDKIYALVKEILTIGRDASNDIAIGDAEVSRRHARLIRQGDDYVIEDLGSTNGTFVNRARIAAPYRLSDGDEIAFGETVAVVYHAKIERATETMITPGAPAEAQPDSTMAADWSPPPPAAPPELRPEPPPPPWEAEPRRQPPPQPVPSRPEPSRAPPPPPVFRSEPEPEPYRPPRPRPEPVAPPPYAPAPQPDYYPPPPPREPVAATPMPPPAYPPVAEEKKPKKSRKLLFGCGCVALVLIVALLAFAAKLLWDAPPEFFEDPLNNFDRLFGIVMPLLGLL